MSDVDSAGAARIISGLYFYVRGGIRGFPRVTAAEIPCSLETNPWYRERLIVLAGDGESAAILESAGLCVYRVFEDAPAEIHRDAAHRMKHWMCLWALRTFGEFLWVDWDTVALREPDPEFWSFCRAGGTPKFIRIPGYWATVNCGVYYANTAWRDRDGAQPFAPRGLPERRTPLARRPAGRRGRCAGVLVGRARRERLDGSGVRQREHRHRLRARARPFLGGTAA